MLVFSKLLRLWEYLTCIRGAEPNSGSGFEDSRNVGEIGSKLPDLNFRNLAADAIFGIRLKVSKQCVS